MNYTAFIYFTKGTGKSFVEWREYYQAKDRDELIKMIEDGLK